MLRTVILSLLLLAARAAALVPQTASDVATASTTVSSLPITDESNITPIVPQHVCDEECWVTCRELGAKDQSESSECQKCLTINDAGKTLHCDPRSVARRRLDDQGDGEETLESDDEEEEETVEGEDEGDEPSAAPVAASATRAPAGLLVPPLTQNATTLSPAAAPSVNVTNATTLSPATAPSVNVTINATLSPAGPTNNITNTTNTTTTAPNTSPVNTTNATMSPATVPSAVTKSPTAAPAPGIPTPRSPIGLPTTDTDEDEDEDEPPTGSPHHEKGESKGPKTGTTPVAESDEGLSAGGIFGIVLVVLFVVVGGAAYMMFGQSSRSSGRYRPDGMRSMEMGRYNSRDDDNGLL